MTETEVKKTGTTTVGIVCKDCIVLAADMRATVGHMIGEKETDKVLPINDRMLVTTAGMASTLQVLVKHLQSQLKLKEIKSSRETTVKEAVNLLRNWVYSIIRTPSMVPDITHFLFAGVDNYGVHLYEIFPDGCLNQEPAYKASGSGSVFALGVLESKYKEGMTQEEGVKLAEECVDVAIQRDSASGNGVNIFVVNKEGARKVLTKRVNTHLQ